MAWIKSFLLAHGLAADIALPAAGIILALSVVLFSILIYYLAKLLLLPIIRAVIKRSRAQWDDILLHNKVFERLILLIPALIIYAFAPAFTPAFTTAEDWVRRVAAGIIVFVLILALNRMLDAIGDIYKQYNVSKTRPIRGYLQVVKIITLIVGIVVIISVLVDRSPLILLGGIGAATAVILLIFQNTILGFVAGIQLTENDMVRLGDWIEIPKHGADGAVVEIALHTVKVQNWDKTITTVPTYALVSESFKNWRPMLEAGGRRIKRSVYIDMASIRFCDEEMLERYRKIQYIQDYIDTKTRDIALHNAQYKIDFSSQANGRHLTNIGTFRHYVAAYLRHYPRVHPDMALMVRQLNPGETGLPIEVYCFTNTTDWEEYEGIKADIFDHILAVLPQFDLRIFQNPSGHDMARMRIGRV
ncbi:MAG: mechanosensitive ion channel [Clostridia bacterium]|nr:mechanosensitive ion channel [Clostridia bacterium]